MKENKLIIRIERPISVVFDFTITPSNTPFWIDSILQEEIEGNKIGIGTRYKNQDRQGKVSLYNVSEFKSNEIFELKAVTSLYTVRYTYTPISENETELEYFEWMQGQDLPEPFDIKNLKRLKSLLEVGK